MLMLKFSIFFYFHANDSYLISSVPIAWEYTWNDRAWIDGNFKSQVCSVFIAPIKKEMQVILSEESQIVTVFIITEEWKDRMGASY